MRRRTWDKTAAAADRLALDVALPCKKKKEGGSVRASPVAAPMPKSVSFLEKKECLDCLDCLELA